MPSKQEHATMTIETHGQFQEHNAAANGVAERVELVYKAFADKEGSGVWRVEALDMASEGECYCASFFGFNAEARAQEYAAWKNANATSSRDGVNSADAQ
jgi:hypothetical protein